MDSNVMLCRVQPKSETAARIACSYTNLQQYYSGSISSQFFSSFSAPQVLIPLTDFISVEKDFVDVSDGIDVGKLKPVLKEFGYVYEKKGIQPRQLKQTIF